MYPHSVSEDSRGVKSKKLLYSAILSLLKKNSFKKITIKVICEEASISRASFYAHFLDKYDLLERWLAEMLPENLDGNAAFEIVDYAVNYNAQENMLILKNLVSDADNETYSVLFNAILSTIKLSVDSNDEKTYAKNVVLSNFYAGGMISYLIWQTENKFPANVPLMNEHIYGIVQEFKNWAIN